MRGLMATLAVAVVALAPIGCGGDAPSGPRAGDRIIFDGGVGFAWSDLDAMRNARRWKALDEAGVARMSPAERDEWEASNKRRAGMIYRGDLVQVLEVGEDYAGVEVVRNGRGEPGPHGYVERWWGEGR